MTHLRKTNAAAIAGLAVSVVAVLAPAGAIAHPWHRHRTAAVAPPVAADPPPTAPTPVRLTAARLQRPAEADIARAFAPFVERRSIACRSDDRFFYVESNGVPDHPLMVGIRAWQQQVPLPQRYVGDNAWRIPLEPVPAATPMSTKDRFLRGAIALAVNGVPIFNPLNNRGEDASLIGELDEHGGHCGRADDYHYHLAPVHLEKQVGKGMPIAYALDGYPIYGYEEPDGSPVRGLDRFNGHEDAAGRYHYHATRAYPYLNGGFHGVVTERDGQVDPQPRAEPVRPAQPPLRGATIVGFTSPTPDSRRLTYEVGGRRGTVEYRSGEDGAVVFDVTDPNGKRTSETYAPRRRGPGPQSAMGRPPGKEGGGSGRAAAGTRVGRLAVTSAAIGPDGRLPREFTCDGAGVSPPLEWPAGPAGTQSYAVILWHEAPDQVKSYWIVYDIPADVTSLARGSRGVGTTGLNDKRRAEYDPMCSKGPGAKTYHLTVYAVSARPRISAATRATLLDAIRDLTLAEGTLTFTYDRGAGR